MNIQRENSAHHFRMQSEREQTLVLNSLLSLFFMFPREGCLVEHTHITTEPRHKQRTYPSVCHHMYLCKAS